MSQDQEDKRRQKEIDEARLEIVRDLHRSGEEFGKMAHQAFLRVRADMRRSREEMEEMDRQRLLQIAADIRKERLSRAILPRHKPINLADVILSHPPISTRIVRTLFGLPAQSPAPVEQPLAAQQAIPNEAEQAEKVGRSPGRPLEANQFPPEACDRIARQAMRLQGQRIPWTEIVRRCGASEKTIRKYIKQYKARQKGRNGN